MLKFNFFFLFIFCSLLIFSCGNHKEKTSESEQTHISKKDTVKKEESLKLEEVLIDNYAWKVSIDSTIMSHKETFPKTTENGLDSIRQSFKKKDAKYYFDKNKICFVVEKPYPHFVADTFEYDWQVPAGSKKILMKNVETGTEEWNVVSFEKNKIIVKPKLPNKKEKNGNLIFVPTEKPKEEEEKK